MKKAVVIGAGLTGLSAAALLAKEDYSVTVIDSQDTIGGKAQMVRREGFLFDISPYKLTEREELFSTLSAIDPRAPKSLSWTKIEPATLVKFGDGDSISIHSDPMKTAEEFDMVEQGTGKMYRNFHKLGKTGSFLSKMRLGNLSKVKTNIKEKQLIDTMLFTGIYYGLNDSISFYAKEHAKTTDIWYPEGGPKQVGELLESLCREYGVSIRLGGKVSEIVCESDRAIGIRVGEEFVPADVIVSSVDEFQMHANMIPARLRKQKSVLAVADCEQTLSSYILCIGLGKEYNLPYQMTCLSYDMDRFYQDLFIEKVIPKDPTFVVKSMKSVLPHAAAPGKDALVVQVPVPSKNSKIDWKTEKERYAKFLLCSLEDRGLEGLRENAEKLLVLSPEEFGKRYKLEYNSLFGPINTTIGDTGIRRLYQINKDRGGGLFSGLTNAREIVNKIIKNE